MTTLDAIKTAFAKKHLDRFFNSFGDFDPDRGLAHDWLAVMRQYPQETDLDGNVENAFYLTRRTPDMTQSTAQLVLDAAFSIHEDAYMRLGERVALAMIDIAWEEVRYDEVACIAQELREKEAA
ncbi:MAG: hypothetical protein ACO3EL_06220 [Burkholderiaceae bacterium]